jgi:acylphosphatase
MEKITKKYIIEGFVQGVGYRYFAHRKAIEYSIYGYAKNLMNGSVEVLAHGLVENIAAFKRQLESGPQRANVKRVSEIQDGSSNFSTDLYEFVIY